MTPILSNLLNNDQLPALPVTAGLDAPTEQYVSGTLQQVFIGLLILLLIIYFIHKESN